MFDVLETSAYVLITHTPDPDTTISSGSSILDVAELVPLLAPEAPAPFPEPDLAAAVAPSPCPPPPLGDTRRLQPMYWL